MRRQSSLSTSLTRKLAELIGVRYYSELTGLFSRVDGTKRRNDPPLATILSRRTRTMAGWSFYFVHEPQPAVGVARTIYRAAPAPCQTLYRIFFYNKLTLVSKASFKRIVTPRRDNVASSPYLLERELAVHEAFGTIFHLEFAGISICVHVHERGAKHFLQSSSPLYRPSVVFSRIRFENEISILPCCWRCTLILRRIDNVARDTKMIRG